MSYTHPSIEKPDEEGVESGQYSPPKSFGDQNVWDEDSDYVPKDHVRANFVETSNPYDDIIDHKDVLANDSIYDQGGFRDPSTVEEIKRQEQNRAKEQELEEREKLVIARENALDNQGVMPYNWPWFWPILYHDIKADIPVEFQVHTRRMYNVCLATMGALMLNWLVMLAALISGDGVASFVWSCVYLGVGGVLAWKTWYKSLYMSLKGGGTTCRWFLFITSYFIHTVFVSLAAIGFESFATSGFFFMMAAFNKNKVVGYMALIGFVFWSVIALCSILLLRRSWFLFRSSDFSEQARKDAFEAVISQTVVAR